jgi:hypothetical protein
VLQPPTERKIPQIPRLEQPRRVHAAPSVELEAVAALVGAPRTAPDNDLVTGGGELRAVVRARYAGASIGIAALSPDVARFGTVGARIHRVPVDISLRGLLPRRKLDWIGDIGVALTALFVEGTGLPAHNAVTTLDPGVRAGAALRTWIAPRLALRFGVETLVSFHAQDLAIAPVGIVGKTPIVWVSTTIGLAVRLH